MILYCSPEHVIFRIGIVCLLDHLIECSQMATSLKGLLQKIADFDPIYQLPPSFALQTFAERLFSRLNGANERFETRLLMMSVISRAIGVHKLLVLNFYPFLQKYIQPHQRDVTSVLAALVQVRLYSAAQHDNDLG